MSTKISIYAFFTANNFVVGIIVQKENNYSVGSGAEITCARLGFQNYQILAAGDDQKHVIIWKITRAKPKLVSINLHIHFIIHYQYHSFRPFLPILQMCAVLDSTILVSTCSQARRVAQCMSGISTSNKPMCCRATRLRYQVSLMMSTQTS